ncbi:hypothetical protein GH5_02292 [Leishmania sp. Ghana 2012 LV757]|uniref:hypothetical protein n=1 Tax=Leishmania sp. Ghana 2012 LV757 TaxID=2803181 RepID=UPI001B756ACA|nr:hypothetical protein GH5_02292 [Leishmania sp. Ghana 2012 LV757]
MTSAPRGARARSSPNASSSCFDGLLYSRRGSGTRPGTHSLARRAQELGAELCGRLSQIALEVSSAALGSAVTASVDVDTATRANGSPLVSSSAASTAPLSFMADVHRDLSAHYGSHAVRRGLAKPLGPCVHPVIHKGSLATQRAGVHSPRYMRVWILRLVRRCWCHRCGVWLTRGVTQRLAKLESCRATLATVKECRVRRQRQPSRRSTTRGRFVLCCLRCLDTAQRIAKRNAGLFGIAAVSQQQQRAVRSTAKSALLTTKRAARKERAANMERTLKAVLAEARVPRRNRRCRRRSQRRRGGKQEARAGAKVTVCTYSRNPKAVLQQSTSASQVTQTLAMSLMRKTKPSTEVAGSGKAAKAPIVEVPHTARTAQKNLQGLVPSGPLKKTVRRVSATPPTPRSSEKSPASSTATCRNSAVVNASPVATSSEVQIPPPVPSPSSIIGGAHARTTDQRVDARQEKDMKAISKTVNSCTKETPPTASVSGPTSFSTNSLLSSAPPRPSVPSMPPKAVASRPRQANTGKKPASPPAKTAAATKKLMDTMSQLGF